MLASLHHPHIVRFFGVATRSTDRGCVNHASYHAPPPVAAVAVDFLYFNTLPFVKLINHSFS